MIEQRYGVKYAERSFSDLLRRLGFRRISVRPRCPEQDAAIQHPAENIWQYLRQNQLSNRVFDSYEAIVVLPQDESSGAEPLRLSTTGIPYDA